MQQLEFKKKIENIDVREAVLELLTTGKGAIMEELKVELSKHLATNVELKKTLYYHKWITAVFECPGWQMGAN